MIRNTRRLALFVFMLVSFVTLARRDALASFQCGAWGSGWACVWYSDNTCDYWEYNCDNTCPASLYFECEEETGSGANGHCECTQ